jgi:Tfp pilus assembly protein PilZ
VRVVNQPRIAKRVPCDVRIDGRSYKGLTLNVSQGGLFVQTTAEAAHGSLIELELSPAGDNDAIPVRATVVWKRVVPHQLRAAARGGLGVQIDTADESYYHLLANWMRVGVPATPTATPLPLFRVRLAQTPGPRSLALQIRAGSANEAGEEALKKIGEGWRIIGVDSV